VQTNDDMNFTNTPNLLTLMRILFVPLIVGLMFLKTQSGDWAAAILFIVASITDYFDGYIARVQKLETVYGKLMDPLADKFLVVSTIIMLQELGRIHPIVVMLLICREMAITSLRALASAEGVVIGASESAKWKTTVQMVAIPLLMVRFNIIESLNFTSYTLGLTFLYISLGLSLWTAKDYVVDFFRGLKEARRLKTQQRKQARDARIASRNARLAAKAARGQTPGQTPNQLPK
jgi:CDP-diacylglycerol--glycerol-3-phosphate 3-phosphatidyltransferase